MSRWPSSVLPCVLMAVLGASAVACNTANRGDIEPTIEAEGELRLELSVEPLSGDAPMVVHARAELVGDLNETDTVRFRCATAAFLMGDNNVQHVPPPQPCSGDVQRVYETTYIYNASGTFPVTVRLIARPVRPSSAMRVLVHGATPTPVPVGAVPGPTIIIATPVTPVTESVAETAADSVAEAVAEAVRGTLEAEGLLGDEPSSASTESTSAPIPVVADSTTVADLPPTVTAFDSRQMEPSAVLPADLVYLAGQPASVMRLPASGDSPVAIGDVSTLSTDDYAVSTLDLVARTAEGSLELLSPLGEARRIASGGTAAPVWSRDGRWLAYVRRGGLEIFDLVDFSTRPLGLAGLPVAFSRAGEWLLVRDGDELYLTRPGETPAPRRDLPIEPASYAGWLPDREVIWLSGPGLRFLSIGDALQITTVIDAAVETSRIFVRPDGRALLLIPVGESAVLHVVDLNAPTLQAELVGVPLAVPLHADFDWSPDGRQLAVAGAGGIALLDPVTGVAAPLVDGPASRPTWLLAGR